MRAGQGGRVRGGLSETLRIRALLTSLTRAPSKALPRFTALYGCTPCRNQFASCCSVQHSRGDSSTGARDWGRPDQPSETHLTTLDVDDFPHGFYSKESKVRSVEGGKEGINKSLCVRGAEFNSNGPPTAKEKSHGLFLFCSP
eukprot:scaffold93505_cov15-Tisochrysis_lutea.AAC.1